jgi:hypothetical protein
MNTKHRIVAALLRLYPASWRREYGAELEDLLLTRPLTAAVAADVVSNGLRQRLRAAEPATLLGLVILALVTGAFAYGADPVVRPSGITWPPLVVSWMNPSTELYVLLLVLCGAWTNLKYGGRIGRSARAGVKVTFIGGIPVMIAGTLMLAGIGNARPSVGFATLVAPIFALPLSGIWGAVGGEVGRRISYLISRLRRGPARS